MEIKLKLRCGSGGDYVIEKTIEEERLRGITMENLLDDFINTSWKKPGDASEMSYVANHTHNRRSILAGYFVNGIRRAVEMSMNVSDCMAAGSGKFEFCFLKPKLNS